MMKIKMLTAVQPDFFDLVIVDECHREAQPQTALGAKYFNISILQHKSALQQRLEKQRNIKY